MKLNKLFICTLSLLALNFASSPILDRTTLFAQETVQTQALSPKVGNKLLELQDMVGAKNYTGAVAQAQTMITWPDLTPYEKSQIYNFLGFANYQAGNTRAALQAYENLISQGASTPAIEQNTLNVMASLYLQSERFNDALRTIDRLMKVVGTPSAELWVLKAQAHYQAGQYQQVTDPIGRAIRMVKQQGRTPKENWLLMQRSAAYESGNFKAMGDSLKELIRYYPKDDYIMQLAGAYSQAGDTKKQLVLTEAMYDAGLKKDASSAKNLANLYLMHELPYNAATVLESSMNSGLIPKDTANLKLIAQAWFLSREDRKAIPALKLAASQSGDPELYIRLAQSHMNIDEWEEAIPHIKESLNRGVKNRRVANTMLGSAYLQLERLDEARAAFQAAGGSQSAQWLKFIDNELMRKEKLKQEIELKKIEKNELLESMTSEEGDS